MGLCRWLGLVDACAYWGEAWHTRVLFLVHWGLQLGHLSGDLASRQLHLQGLQAAQVPSAERVTMQAAAKTTNRVRDKAKNSLHVALLLLLDTTLQRQGRCLTTTGQPTKE